MPWLKGLRKSLARMIAPSEEKDRHKLDYDKRISSYPIQPKKDSLSPQSRYFTPQSSHIPTPPLFNKQGRVSGTKVVPPKVFISTRPESRHKPFPATKYIYKTRVELMTRSIQEQVSDAWAGDVEILNTVLDILLRDDVIERLERNKERELQRSQSVDSAENFLNGDARRKSTLADLGIVNLFNTPATEKDVEIVFSKFDKKLMSRRSMAATIESRS